MASGRPDWYGSMTMHGKYTVAGVDTYKSLNVDVEGNLLALMTGLLEGVYTPIAVDDEGIMKANIALQDLDPLSMRVYHGVAKSYHTFTPCPFDAVGATLVKEITGKGMIYSGYMCILNEGAHIVDKPEVKIDGQSMGAMTWGNYPDRGIYKPGMFPTYCTLYDPVNGSYCVALTPGMTFESKVELLYENNHADDDVVCYYGIGYAEIT